jgi:hypothetical protein
MKASYKTYNSIFGQPPQIDISRLPRFTPPRINIPHVTPAVVATPANLEARINTIYAPRYAELAHQQELQDRAVMGQAAAAGLGDSGVAVSARAQQDEQFGRERASLQGQQAGDRLNIEYQTLSQNAANQQAANLANAQLSLAGQQANAQAILAGQTAYADNYLKALGINAEIADHYRQGFLSYFTVEQQAKMQKDQLSQQFNASLLDAMLKQAGIEQQASQFAQTQQLERDKLTAAQSAPTGEFGYNPYSPGTIAYNKTIPGYQPPRTDASSNPSNWSFPTASSSSPTLALTNRIFGGAPRSLGVGGL